MEILQNIGNEFLGLISVNFLTFLLILITGWIGACFIANFTRWVLHKTDIDNRLAAWVSGGKATSNSIQIENLISTIVFYTLMVLVFIVSLMALDNGVLDEPMQELIEQIITFIPKLFSALILSVVAFVLAHVAKSILFNVLSFVNVEQYFQKLGNEQPANSDNTATDTQEVSPTSKTIATSISESTFWFILLIFLPTILSKLGLSQLLEPVEELLARVFEYLPNVIAAVAIFGVGYLVAKILKQIVVSLSEAAGVNTLAEKIGLNKIIGAQSCSNLLGTLVHFLVIFSVLTSSLQALSIESISEPAQQILSSIFMAIPPIISSVFALGFAILLGRFVSSLIVNLLTGIGFNNIFSTLGVTNNTQEANKVSPAQIIGYIVSFSIVLFTASAIADYFHFVQLASILKSFITFAGHILFGVLVFAGGFFLSTFVSDILTKSAIKQASLLATIARISILFVTGAISLITMGVGTEIVQITFGLLLGAIAVAFAIAVGFGCKDIAAREVDSAIQSLKDNSDKG